MNRILSLLVAFVLAAAPLHAVAESLIKPLPVADLSRVDPAARAGLLEAQKEFDTARQSLLGAPLADAYARLGSLYARHRVFPMARAALENAIALAPEDGRYAYLLGVFLAQDGQLAPARTQLERALALDKEYLPIRYRLAELLVAQDDLAGARRTLEEVARLRPDLATAPALLGELALREKRYADAVVQLRKALAADPDATALHAPLADALAATGDSAGAAAARAKVGTGVVTYADPLLQGVYTPSPAAAAAASPADAALMLAAQGRHADARKGLDAQLAKNPNDVAALSAYARVLADVGDASGASARAAAALRAAPNDAGANLAQGIVLEVAGQEAQAIPFYERAVRADLKNAQARLLLGQAYQRRSQPGAAAEQYRALAQAAPEDGSAFARLAVVLAQSGRCGDALREVNDGLKRRPKDGGLLQTFVRLAATCPAASAEERQMAVDYAQSLYDARPDEAHAEALAMALAATGKAKDAVDYQAQAMFGAVKRNDDAAIARMKPLLERFKAGQKAATPWPAGHPFVAPPRLSTSRAERPPQRSLREGG